MGPTHNTSPIPHQCLLTSCGSCNKVPQTRWFKTGELCGLTVLEVRSSESRCWQRCFLLEAGRENPSHASLLASGSFRQSLGFLGASPSPLALPSHDLRPVSLCAYPNLPLLIRTPVIRLEPTLIRYDLILA